MKILLMALVVAGMVGTVIPTQAADIPNGVPEGKGQVSKPTAANWCCGEAVSVVAAQTTLQNDYNLPRIASLTIPSTKTGAEQEADKSTKSWMANIQGNYVIAQAGEGAKHKQREELFSRNEEEMGQATSPPYNCPTLSPSQCM